MTGPGLGSGRRNQMNALGLGPVGVAMNVSGTYLDETAELVLDNGARCFPNFS
jgi:hypothetical protein